MPSPIGPAGAQMFVLQVNIRIKPENVDDFMRRALENGKAARTTEPG